MMRNPKHSLELKSDKMLSQKVENVKSIFIYIFIAVARFLILPDNGY